MGLFDDIDFEIECPNCKTKMDDFQSKDGQCLMHTLKFWEVNNFYAGCPECNTWVEYTLKNKSRPNRKLTIKDYKKEVQISTKKEQLAHKKKYEDFAKMLKGNSSEDVLLKQEVTEDE